MSGIVFDIQRGALHDGPGLRTTVFLKGCPLRCRWCHNPESWSLQPQQAAPVNPADAPTVFGREMSVKEVMREVRKDQAYYESSGGGVTLSGGEPTLQWEFCRELLHAAHREGFHTCLDTCGVNRTELFLELLPYVNLILWDFKATGIELHRALTGVQPGPILRNFEALYEKGAAILLRCPLVPGVNDGPEHFEALAKYALDYPRLAGIEILPYHKIGLSKYARLGLAAPELQAEPPADGMKEAWRAYFKRRGCTNVTVV